MRHVIVVKCSWNMSRREENFKESRTDRDHDFCVTPVSYQTLGSGIEERLSIFWFGASLEYCLVVEDDGTVSGRNVTTMSLCLITFVAFGLFFVDALEFEACYLVDLDRIDAGGMALQRRCRYDHGI